MLAELQDLTRSLKDYGISPEPVHPWVKPLGKGPLIIAALGDSFSVRQVELQESAQELSVGKVEKDNQNSFPANKIVGPIFVVDKNDAGRDALQKKGLTDKGYASVLGSLCGAANLSELALAKNSKKIASMLRFSCELRPIFAPFLSDHVALSRLFSFTAVDKVDIGLFLTELAREIIAAVTRGESRRLAEQLLIGVPEKKKKDDKNGVEIPILFDVWKSPEEDFVRVARPKTVAFFHRVLFSRQLGESDGRCALTGEFQCIERRTLPKPRLPELGNTIIYSANPDTGCLDRYGLTGAAAFPIGKGTAQSLNDAFTWVTQPSRQGKSWTLVPRNDNSRSDLLIAYVDQVPDLPEEVAELFGDMSAHEIEGAYEYNAGTVIESLRARSEITKEALLHTLVLRKISEGQVQVEFSRLFQIGRIDKAFEEWRLATKNLPSFGLYVPVGKGTPAKFIEPEMLSPGQIVRATKSIWIRGGTEQANVIGCPLAVVYDLYLGEGRVGYSAAKLLLPLVVNRTTPLLLRVADQLGRFGWSAKDLPSNARHDAIRAFALLGVLLYKLDRKKETYMHETPFLLGRMLALADTLHAQYCAAVRGGSIPPQLLGNQHYAMMADRPARACRVLGDRLKIYQAWAESARSSELDGPERAKAIRLAKWALARMAEVAPELHGRLPEKPFGDIDAAEMLLGYLSRGKQELAREETGE
ncbi:MAG TPA: hypothetical protein VH325_02230 [Bryobacteraceae bacterium]|jgi:hypothetical protein|nr:hypothetical protein [Bryobacteraceae bacterium]